MMALFIRYLISNDYFDLFIKMLNEHDLPDNFFDMPPEDWIRPIMLRSCRIFLNECLWTGVNGGDFNSSKFATWGETIKQYQLTLSRRNKLLSVKNRNVKFQNEILGNKKYNTQKVLNNLKKSNYVRNNNWRCHRVPRR